MSETERRVLWAIRWPDGKVSAAFYGNRAEHRVRQAAGDDEVVTRTEIITRTPWETAPPRPTAHAEEGDDE